MYAKLLSWMCDDIDIVAQATCATNRSGVDPNKLIPSLIAAGHSKPFQCCVFHFEVGDMPIFVDRQLVTHQLMFASTANSGRYGATKMEAYIWEDIIGGTEELQIRHEIDEWMRATFKNYEDAVNRLKACGNSASRAREKARTMLPIGQLITRRFCMNLVCLANFMAQRQAPEAQLEIRLLADAMEDACKEVAPIAWQALKEQDFCFGNQYTKKLKKIIAQQQAIIDALRTGG